MERVGPLKVHKKGKTMRMIVGCVLLLALTIGRPILAQGSQATISPGGFAQEDLAVLRQSAALVDKGEALLKAGNFGTAEQMFRTASAVQESEALGHNPSAERGLAEALVYQGRTTEALSLYRALIYGHQRKFSSVSQELRTTMRYSILLTQTDQWPEAVAVYEKALPSADFHGMPKMDVHFDPRVPMPAQLQTIAHLACGIEFNRRSDDRAAFNEYVKASYLAPDSALVNYYYGDGWQNLSPKDRAKLGSVQQAKAALQKAYLLGKGDVKTAAEKALKELNKPTDKPA